MVSSIAEEKTFAGNIVWFLLPLYFVPAREANRKFHGELGKHRLQGKCEVDQLSERWSCMHSVKSNSWGCVCVCVCVCVCISLCVEISVLRFCSDM